MYESYFYDMLTIIGPDSLPVETIWRVNQQSFLRYLSALDVKQRLSG